MQLTPSIVCHGSLKCPCKEYCQIITAVDAQCVIVFYKQNVYNIMIFIKRSTNYINNLSLMTISNDLQEMLSTSNLQLTSRCHLCLQNKKCTLKFHLKDKHLISNVHFPRSATPRKKYWQIIMTVIKRLVCHYVYKTKLYNIISL